MAELCNKCYCPKHVKHEIQGIPFVTCVYADKNEIVFTDKWVCGCCKCEFDQVTFEECGCRKMFNPKTGARWLSMCGVHNFGFNLRFGNIVNRPIG